MGKCPTCKGELKALFTTWFCPKCTSKPTQSFAPHYWSDGFNTHRLPDDDCEALTRFAEYAVRFGSGHGTAHTRDGAVVVFEIKQVVRKP